MSIAVCSHIVEDKSGAPTGKTPVLCHIRSKTFTGALSDLVDFVRATLLKVLECDCDGAVHKDAINQRKVAAMIVSIIALECNITVLSLPIIVDFIFGIIAS